MSQGPSSGLVHQVEEFLRQAAQQGGPDAGAATSIADAAPQQPELRRPALTEPQLFQVSITLDGAEPPIWRRLELRSNLSLDHVHQAIQCAFYWVDYHLHRFSIGGHAFDQQAQHFLCRYDAEEGDPGIPDAGIELSETIQEPGETLHYLYDYGDSWEVSIELEEVLPLAEEATWARCTDGGRAAPPEDSRGATEAEVIQLVGDLEAFDADEINNMLDDADPAGGGQRVPARVEPVLVKVTSPQIYLQMRSKLRSLRNEPGPEISPEEKQTALAAFVWFLDQAEQEQLPLTQAGYLKPAVVAAASEVVPTCRRWIGKHNREDQTMPVLRFRQALQRMGLLRKYKGQLKLTKKGRGAKQSTQALWEALVREIITSSPGAFEYDLAVLELLEIPTSSQARVNRRWVLETVNSAGWTVGHGHPVSEQDLWQFQLTPSLLLRELDPDGNTRPFPDRPYSPAARALARQALLLA